VVARIIKKTFLVKVIPIPRFSSQPRHQESKKKELHAKAGREREVARAA